MGKVFLLCVVLCAPCTPPGLLQLMLSLCFLFALQSVTANLKAAVTAAAEDPLGLHGAWRERRDREEIELKKRGREGSGHLEIEEMIPDDSSLKNFKVKLV